MFDMLKSKGINLIRVFVYPGHTSIPDHNFPIQPTSVEYPVKFAIEEDAGTYYITFNDSYFDDLDVVLRAASEHDVYVMLSFFDFSEEINSSEWDRNAWNPDNNHTDLSYHYSNFCSIWDASDNLKPLGELQRLFVWKIVNETYMHNNVIYEIANEPDDRSDLFRWIKEVASWVKVVEAVYDSDAHMLCVAFTRDGDSNTFQALLTDSQQPLIDILSRHSAFGGYDIDNSPPCRAIPNPEATADPDELETCGIQLNVQANKMTSFLTPYNRKVCLVDTDGCHRGGTIEERYRPLGRDFDANCQKWAIVANNFNACFNTKETLCPYPNSSERDWVTLTSSMDCHWDEFNGSMPSPTPTGTLPPTPTPLPTLAPGAICSNCDDFWWEDQDNFEGFDVGLADELDTISRRSFILSIGFFPYNYLILKSSTLFGYDFNFDQHLKFRNATTAWDSSPGDNPWELSSSDVSPTYEGGFDDFHIFSLPENLSPYLMAKFVHDKAPSDPWPFLTVHPNTPRTSSQSPQTDLLDYFDDFEIEPCSEPIPRTIQQFWGIEPEPTSILAKPRFLDAGYGYSSLNSGIGTGVHGSMDDHL